MAYKEIIRKIFYFLSFLYVQFLNKVPMELKYNGYINRKNDVNRG